MTKTDYLNELKHHLRKLPKADFQEAMDYFEEYFAEAGEENELALIAELGTPKEAASDIINNILGRQAAEPEQTPRSRAKLVGLTILAILAVPIGVPLLIGFVLFLLGFVTFIVAMFVAAFLVSLAMFVAGAVFIWEAFTLLGTLSVAAMGFGAGLSLIGGGLILAIITSYFVKVSFLGLKSLIKWFIQRGRKHETKI